MSKRPLCLMAVCSVLLLLVFMNCLPDVFRQENIPAENGETVILGGRIYDRQEKDDKTQFYLEEVVFIESGRLSSDSDGTEPSDKHSDVDTSSKFQGKCIVYCSDIQQYSIGNYIQLSGTISLFEKATNPGQFDAKSYYRGLGIDFAVFQTEILSSDNQKDVIREGLYSFRSSIHNRLNGLAGKQASILQAMLLGEKSQMDAEIKELYQKSGISHILVISGLHFSLLGMFLYRMLRKSGASFCVAGIASIGVLFFYGLMTGFGVSAVRAFIMFAISVGADICGRSYDFPTSLGAAVLYLVLQNPYVLYQTGFLLSVGAVLGIIIMIPVVEELFPEDKNMDEKILQIDRDSDHKTIKTSWLVSIRMFLQKLGVKIRRIVLSGICSGIAIQIMTFPILLYSFCEFSPYSILLNCLILPLVSVVILGAIGAVSVSFFSLWAGKIMILPSIWVLQLYEFLCRCVEKLPESTIVTGKPQMYEIVIYYVVLAVLVGIVCVIKRRDLENVKGSKWFRYAITGILVAMGSFLVISKNNSGMEIVMLDVGQGQSIYIRCGNSDVLYDGGSTDVSQVGKYRIVPFLKAKGVDCLELVIVSHLDADHYNGIMQILEENLIEIECLMLPQLDEPDEAYMELREVAKAQGVQIEMVEKQDSFQVEETEFRILHPYQGFKTDSKNDSSIVMSMEYGDFTMLFTGDVEENGEESMLEEGILEEVDLLQVAHHGSDSSTIPEFLDVVSPKLAWISCGEDNRYGHPSKTVIKRLEKLECQYYITMENGCISLKLE